MPTYEYVCQKCGRTFDYFQSMKDPRLTNCILEGCDGEVRRKIGTGAGIIFKGSGFYETDYRSDAYKSAAKKDEGGGAPAEGKESKKEGGKKDKESKKESSPKKESASPPAGGGKPNGGPKPSPKPGKGE